MGVNMSKVTLCRSRTITVIRRGRFQGTPREQKAARPCATALSLETSAAPCAQHTLPICIRAGPAEPWHCAPGSHQHQSRGFFVPFGVLETGPFWGLGRAQTLMCLSVCRGKRGGWFKGEKEEKKNQKEWNPDNTKLKNLRNSKHRRKKGSHHCICPAGTGAGP